MRAIFTTSCFVLLLAAAGCASQGVYLPPNTLFLGEVSHILTTQQVAEDKLGPNTKVENLSSKLNRWGFTSEQIDKNRVAIVREGIYWNNIASGIKRDMLRPALIPNGLEVQAGNIIEGEDRDKDHPYTIIRIRSENIQAGSCHYDELATGLVKGLMGVVSLVGPSGAATLYCKGIENEGWRRPRTYWHKLQNTESTK